MTLSDHLRLALRSIDAAQELAGDDEETLLGLRQIGAELREMNRRAIEDDDSAPTLICASAADAAAADADPFGSRARMVARSRRDASAMAEFLADANREAGR